MKKLIICSWCYSFKKNTFRECKTCGRKYSGLPLEELGEYILTRTARNELEFEIGKSWPRRFKRAAKIAFGIRLSLSPYKYNSTETFLSTLERYKNAPEDKV